jgi:hypothetical protein
MHRLSTFGIFGFGDPRLVAAKKTRFSGFAGVKSTVVIAFHPQGLFQTFLGGVRDAPWVVALFADRERHPGHSDFRVLHFEKTAHRSAQET